MFQFYSSGVLLASMLSMAVPPLCAQASAQHEPTAAETSAAEAPADGQEVPTSRCGVYSVFAVSALCGHSVPLSRCAEVIPIRPRGNTMAELKSGMERLGFLAEGYALRQGAMKQHRGTWIVWVPPGLEYQTPDGERFLTGHFVVLHSEEDREWLLLDYPASGARVEADLWLAQILLDAGLDEVPALRVRVDPKPPNGQHANTELPHAEPAGAAAPGEANGRIDPSADDPAQAFPRRVSVDAERSLSEVSVNDLSSSLVSTVLDFGDRCEGEQLYGVVVLWNGTDQPLVLEGVTSTCGCTVPALEDSTLWPGESVDLDIAMSLSGRTGTVRQSVSCIAVAGERRVPVFVECVAESAKQWTSEPRAAAFGPVRRSDGPVTMPVTVRAAFPSRTSPLVRASSVRRGITAMIDGEASDARLGIYRVLVTITPNAMDPGFLAGDIQLFSQDHGTAEVVVPVTAHVQ